jgi:hypothetical protein
VVICQVCVKVTSKLHYTIHETEGTSVASGTEVGVTKACLTGFSVLGGGVQTKSGSTAVNLRSTFPGTGV